MLLLTLVRDTGDDPEDEDDEVPDVVEPDDEFPELLTEPEITRVSDAPVRLLLM
jgi:hypothetical protein